jgi:DNA-binding response OmpR family regulator
MSLLRALCTAKMLKQPLVLVIEDDPTISSLIEFRLKREGYAITKVADGHAAMAAFGGDVVPNLVVMDVMMPFYDGYELLTNMRSRESWKHVPVIILTSMSREEDILKGLEMGATDYVIKPFRPAELSARVKSLLARAS